MVLWQPRMAETVLGRGLDGSRFRPQLYPLILVKALQESENTLNPSS